MAGANRSGALQREREHDQIRHVAIGGERLRGIPRSGGSRAAILSELIETAALARIREAQFVDDAEAAEILSDDALVQRMKTGSRQARQHVGEIANWCLYRHRSVRKYSNTAPLGISKLLESLHENHN